MNRAVISYKGGMMVLLNPKEQLMYLLEHYYIGNYDTETFADEFHRIYHFEVDDKDLSAKEKNALSELSTIVARFSPFEEDLKIPNMYFSEKDVKEKATEVYLKLVR